MKVLLISICKEKLHELEFVKPVEYLLKYHKISFFMKHYKNLTEKDLQDAEKIIICGTSLKDFEYFSYLDNFNWLKKTNIPVLGICAGMQIIGKVFGGKIKKKTEIGFFREEFKKEFLGFKGIWEVWHLHNSYIDFFELDDFEIFSSNSVPQAVKHYSKEIYGVLFHPEVRNKEIIINFLK